MTKQIIRKILAEDAAMAALGKRWAQMGLLHQALPRAVARIAEQPAATDDRHARSRPAEDAVSRGAARRADRGGFDAEGTVRRPWTAEEREKLAAIYPSLPSKEVARQLGREIGAVYRQAAKLGVAKSQEFLDSPASNRLRKGETRPGAEKSQFPKGHKPWNAGLRLEGWTRGRMAETQFKKGSRSGRAAKNWKPIGTIAADSDGYLRIKVREAAHGKEHTGYGNTKVWPLLHRYRWEQANGPIPAGHIVTFKDGDRSNCSLENLALMSMADNARRNQMWTKMPRELAEAIQLNGALKRQVRRLNGKEQDQ